MDVTTLQAILQLKANLAGRKEITPMTTTEAVAEMRKKIQKVRVHYREREISYPIDVTGPRGQRLRLTPRESYFLREAMLEAELKALGVSK